MVQINFARREVNCKIVYYGPGLSGKTTNLEIIHKRVPEGARRDLTSIATEQDRTLFFDFMPLDLGQVAGMKTKLLLYTVPGQVYYNSTRKLVLQGADGIAFVGDSDPNRMVDNLDSMRNLEENLREYNQDLRKIPFVIQYNKRDLPGATSIAELNSKLNSYNVPYFEAVAVRGDGVMATLKGLAKIVIDRLNEDYVPGKATAVVTQRPNSVVAAASAVRTNPHVVPAPVVASVPAVAAKPHGPPHPSPVSVPVRAPATVHPPVRPVMPSELGRRGASPARSTARTQRKGTPRVRKGRALKWILVVLALMVGGAAAWYFVGGGEAMFEQWLRR